MIKGSTIVRTSKPVRKEWKQSYSCFTEQDYLGAGLCRVVPVDAQERDTSIRISPAIELIFQSSINPKK